MRGDEKKRPSGTIRQKITKGGDYSEGGAQIKYPFPKVEKTLQEMGLHFGFSKENRQNFMIGTDGGEYYLDATHPFVEWWIHANLDTEEIGQYMQEKGYSERDIRIVQNSIGRLLELTSIL